MRELSYDEACIDAAGKASGFAIAAAALSIRWTRAASAVAAIAAALFTTRLVVNLSSSYNRRTDNTVFVNNNVTNLVVRAVTVIGLLALTALVPSLGIALGTAAGITIGMQIGHAQYLHLHEVNY